MTELVNHLWQSTLFAAAAALIAFACRNNRASVRHAIWLAASVKFLVPFAPLVSLGLHWNPPTSVIATVPAAEAITASFSPLPVPTDVAAATIEKAWWPEALFAVWLFSFAVLLIRRVLAWMRLRAVCRSAADVAMDSPIPVRVAQSSRFEPGVFGLFRPVLLLPQGILEALTEAEFRAIAAHEFAHVQRRDNLTSAIHMLVETLFWFHPLVWWIGAKLIDERERACDEAVLDAGSNPHVYAQGIVNVCKYYVESPLACAAGIGGGTLRERIADVLHAREITGLTGSRKAALACTGVAAMLTPLTVGMLRAQTLPPPSKYKFEVASIKSGDPSSQRSQIAPGPQGGLRTVNTTVMTLLSFAYDLREFQLAGGPEWIRSAPWNITATPDTPEEAPSPSMSREKMEAGFKRQGQRMQALLADRFGLVMRIEDREMPVYILRIGKDGHKLSPSKDEGPNMRTNQDRIEATGADVPMLVRALSGRLGRPVLDETGLSGAFTFKMQWTPETSQAEAAGASIFTAVQEQLGLKLESKRAKAPVYVIEKIEKPTEN
jgi:bla regulator protein blaR1